MKFKFDKDVSRIYDYLLFPRICFYIDDFRESRDEDDMIKDVIDDDYVEMTKHLNEKLKIHEKEINQYFQRDIYAKYDYPNILINAFPVETYRDEKTYLEDIKGMDELAFRDKIMKSLVTMDDDDVKTDKDVDVSNASDYINSLKIDSANKWNLFMMIQSPKKYFLDFCHLLEAIEPIFYETYGMFEDKVLEVGERLSKKLSNSSADSFRKLTQNLINYEFSGDEVCLFYVSSIFQYSLSLRDDQVIIWGLKSEESFKKVAKLNENQMIQRVKVFKALGDKTRYEVLKLIANGASSVKLIAEKLDVSSATISYHINEFLTSGIVSINRNANKKAGYTIDYDKLERVIENLREDLNFNT